MLQYTRTAGGIPLCTGCVFFIHLHLFIHQYCIQRLKRALISCLLLSSLSPQSHVRCLIFLFFDQNSILMLPLFLPESRGCKTEKEHCCVLSLVLSVCLPDRCSQAHTRCEWAQCACASVHVCWPLFPGWVCSGCWWGGWCSYESPRCSQAAPKPTGSSHRTPTWRCKDLRVL